MTRGAARSGDEDDVLQHLTGRGRGEALELLASIPWVTCSQDRENPLGVRQRKTQPTWYRITLPLSAKEWAIPLLPERSPHIGSPI